MGRFDDLYHVDLTSGERKLIGKRMSRGDTNASVSPSGRYVAYYNQDAVWLYDVRAW